MRRPHGSVFVRLCGKKCFLKIRRDRPNFDLNFNEINGFDVSHSPETDVGQSGTNLVLGLFMRRRR